MNQARDGGEASERGDGGRLLSTGAILIAGSIVISVAFIWAATSRNLTTLENVLLQTFALGAGLAGSFIYGKDTSRNAARDLIRPVARSAFRRLMTVYRGFAQLKLDIEDAREHANGALVSSAVLDRLQATVEAHTLTAADALADWQDMVPDAVNELLRPELMSREGKGN